MYLNHDEIVSLCFSGEMLDWDDACVNAASLDVRLGDTVLFERAPGRKVNYGKRERLDMMEVKLDAGGIVIKPGIIPCIRGAGECQKNQASAPPRASRQYITAR